VLCSEEFIPAEHDLFSGVFLTESILFTLRISTNDYAILFGTRHAEILGLLSSPSAFFIPLRIPEF